MAQPSANPVFRLPSGDETYGWVKSYHGKKGFGFIGSEKVEGDIMFSRNELPDDAKEVRGNFLEGRSVIFSIGAGPDGRFKAKSVAISAEEGQPLPGVVKSYNRQRGYGFLTSSSLSGDIHFDHMHFDGLNEVNPSVSLVGELVSFVMKQMPNGWMRARKVQFQTKHIAQRIKGQGVSGFPMPGMNVAPMIPHAAGSTGLPIGVVRSFNNNSGYGFIEAPGISSDIFFGKKDVPGGAIAVGSVVKFSLVRGPDGKLQGKNLQDADLPNQGMNVHVKRTPVQGMKRGIGQVAMAGGLAKTLKVDTTPTGEYDQGVVKSYNRSKGFGFINSSSGGIPGDIFFLRSSLQSDIQDQTLDGEMVSYELARSVDGNVRALNISLTPSA